ncbi:hypothetical protein K2805_004507 [Salmonella enterica]|nr:hypothetical protein [Salmonella enterica]EIL4066161.1 hypothetical protein [Salmonella enterica]
MTDITALMATMKAAAEKAGCEQWQSKKNGPGEYGVMVKGSMVKHRGWSTHRPVCDEAVDKKTADFIAAANPANVLGLVEALESRTVTVKLPMPYDINVAGEHVDWEKGDHFDRDEVIAALTAAGIQVIEGEGQ